MNACVVQDLVEAVAATRDRLVARYNAYNDKGRHDIPTAHDVLGVHDCICAYVVYDSCCLFATRFDVRAHVSVRYANVQYWCCNNDSGMLPLSTYSIRSSQHPYQIGCMRASLRVVQWMHAVRLDGVRGRFYYGISDGVYSDDPDVLSYLLHHTYHTSYKQKFLDTAIVHGNFENVYVLWRDPKVVASQWTIDILCMCGRLGILQYIFNEHKDPYERFCLRNRILAMTNPGSTLFEWMVAQKIMRINM